MKQFRYRPPSAGRSLIRNSDHEDEDEDEEENSQDSEKKLLKKEGIQSLKIYINEIIQRYFV